MPHERWPRRPRSALAGLGLCLLLIGLAGCQSEQAKQEAAYKERYAKAKALFEERCKTAGVVIHRTVKDVEGIELTKVRPEIPWGGKEYFDPMFPGAAMAGGHQGENYIKQFLMHEFLDERYPESRGGLGPPTTEKNLTRPKSRKGYAFVEVLDPSGTRIRCEPDWSQDHPNWVDGQHHCHLVTASSTRYALDFEDIVNPADRQLWVAGTRVKVIDKQTGEVVATLTKFVWDPGFGVSTTGRLPWQHADGMSDRTCPAAPVNPVHKHSRYFIDTVLIPKQGD